jgi:hypothetical protein
MPYEGRPREQSGDSEEKEQLAKSAQVMIRCPKQEDSCSRSSKATSITTRCQETSRAWGCSVTGCLRYGGVLSAAGARDTGSRGRAFLPWPSIGFLNRARFIPFRMHASPPFICDKNRMR